MRLSTIVLFLIAFYLMLGTGCIGHQPPQQGTWSGQDNFRAKTTPGVKEPKEK